MIKITVARALTARFARRIMALVTIIAAVAFTALFLFTGALAHFFSVWWWLLLLPILLLTGIFLIMRLATSVIVSRIHVGHLTKQQSDTLDGFIEKVEQAIEARATPWPIIAIICFKDILFHRDLRTVKSMISDTIGLRRDYQKLEKLFS